MLRIQILLCLGMTCPDMVGFGQSKDSVFLQNGQVLIGEVQGANLGVLSIDDVDLKTQSVKLYKIKRLRMYERFKIGTLDKRLYDGFLDVASKEGWVVIRTDTGATRTIPIVNITELIPLSKGFFKRLDGNLSAGLSFTKSSGIGQVNASASVGFATRLFEYQMQASEIGSIDTSRFSRDNESLQIFVGYDLSGAWFLAANAQYQRNLELSIARRWLGLLGAGNRLVIKDSWQLMGISGITFSQEKSTEDVSSGLLLEIPLMFRFNFYKFHHPNIQITSSQTAYISLSDKDRIRYDGSTSFSWELIRYFYLSIVPYTNFDSKPPTGSNNKFDYGIVVSLSYKF